MFIFQSLYFSGQAMYCNPEFWFQICVSKLKSWIQEGNINAAFPTPIIGQFMDVSFQSKIFQLYATTSNICSWLQLNVSSGLSFMLKTYLYYLFQFLLSIKLTHI